MSDQYESEASIEFNESLLDKIDHGALLIDYIATCGIKQKALAEYISNTQLPLLEALSLPELKKANLKPDVTGCYPPTDKPSFPFPSCLQNFCFPTGYKVIKGTKEANYTSSFTLTNETGEKTYVT